MPSQVLFWEFRSNCKENQIKPRLDQKWNQLLKKNKHVTHQWVNILVHRLHVENNPNKPRRATACPWHLRHAPRWDACRHHRWVRPSCRGRANSRAHPSALGHRLSVPCCEWTECRDKSRMKLWGGVSNEQPAGVERLTRSCCSWSGPGGRGHSWRSVAALRWWRDTSGKYTCPGRELSRGCGTAGTGAWVQERSGVVTLVKEVCHDLSESTFPPPCFYREVSAFVCVNICLYTCRRFWQSPRPQAPPGKCRSRSSRGASCCSWP